MVLIIVLVEVEVKRAKRHASLRLGQLLLERHLIDAKQLDCALLHQVKMQCSLGQSLLALGFIKTAQLDRVLAKQKRLHSLLAGVVLMSAPSFSAYANDSLINFKSNSSYSQGVNQTVSLTNKTTATAAKYSIDDYYHIGIHHHFSFRSGVQLNFTQAPSFNSDRIRIKPDNEYSNGLHPEMVFYTSNELKRFSLSVGAEPRTGKLRNDRYKNTTPLVYKLTLKGYSLFEKNQYETGMRFWEFNRNKDSFYKNYELMFSLTKSF